MLLLIEIFEFDPPWSVSAYFTETAVLTLCLQLRRQIRERRSYVYQKSQESQERQTYERKQVLKDALASGKSLPTELRKDSKRLGKQLEFDEAQTGAPLVSHN